MAGMSFVCLLALAPVILATDPPLDDGVCVAKIRQHIYPRTCKDVKSRSNAIYQMVIMHDGTEMMCETHTDGGGWTVLQRRQQGDVDFERKWDEYKYGFAGPSGDFWYGLERISELTTKRSYELYISFDFNNNNYHARYNHFRVMSEKENYKLQVSGYSGDAGDSLSYHNNAMFTTKDKDNDASKDRNCAQTYNGAWWYVSCHRSNLNGLWGSTEFGKGVTWKETTTQYNSATNVVIMMRPIF